MKTTIDIADSLLIKSKRLAQKEDITLRQLVEEGLTLVLKRHEVKKPFRFKPVVFGGGGGMRPEFREGGWPAIRDEIYKGRGA